MATDRFDESALRHVPHRSEPRSETSGGLRDDIGRPDQVDLGNASSGYATLSRPTVLSASPAPAQLMNLRYQIDLLRRQSHRRHWCVGDVKLNLSPPLTGKFARGSRCLCRTARPSRRCCLAPSLSGAGRRTCPHRRAAGGEEADLRFTIAAGPKT